MEPTAALSAEHLLLRLRMLLPAILRAVNEQRDANRVLALSKAKTLYLSDAHVAELLTRADGFARRTLSLPNVDPDQDAPALEQDLRRRMLLAGQMLPLDRLAALGITRQEQDALVFCAAPELDRAYERIYAYILDDLSRRLPSVALLSELTTATSMERAWSLHVLGPFGPLRRRRLLVSAGDAPNEARQELRLGPGLLDYLLSGRAAPASIFRDRADVDLPAEPPPVDGIEPARLQQMADGLRHGKISLAGVWGEDAAAVGEVVRALCVMASMSVRRLVTGDVKCRENCPREEVRKAFLASATLQTVLWVETDQLAGEAGDAAVETLHEQLLVSPIPVVVSGKTPWRPSDVLAIRSFQDVELEPPGYGRRSEMWTAAVPAVPVEQSRRLASRYRLSWSELHAAARLAGTSAILAGNGHPAPVGPFLDDACATVTRRASLSFARFVTPRRGAADLVLPPALHSQILEIARFQQAAPRVAEEWGFSRIDPGAGALRALFTGDSGTGKTLAAEAIAFELGAPLIKVDLARIVSKWIGETEKNLAAVFDEARSMHAVLFFDEADALFGRRGDVQRGTDRYANLEVSYLLTRLDEHDSGVVILASNLKDNIDAAFTRRFQVSLHFPRPTQELRRRLWQLAIPDKAPAFEVDFDVLARVDLTGGGIVGAAKTAALLAADAGEPIGMPHLVRGVARQFTREARLLTTAELGPFAALTQDA